MNDLRSRLIKNSTISLTSTLTDSKVYGKSDMITTDVPIINTALSGSIDGGITPGILLLCGPSKHFKTGFSLLMASAYLKKYPDGIILFYDSEFGSPQSYFKSFDIPTDSVIHTPITDIEELTFDIKKQLDNIDRKDHVMIVIDSIGNLASKREVDNADKQNSAADLSRPKALKGLFRIITPHLTLKDIPLIAVNHIYMEMGLYPKAIVSGGQGAYLSSNDIWVLGRQQEKDNKDDPKEVTGYNFIINIEKSRFVKEKSKIPVTVSYNEGIHKWSGLLELALEGNYVAKPKNGWYALVDQETGELKEPNMRLADIVNNKDIWEDLLKNTDFPKFIEKKYKMPVHNQEV